MTATEHEGEKMTQKRTTRFWIEAWVAAASGLLCVATLLQRDWIELVFRVDPDQGSGTLEWSIVVFVAINPAIRCSVARARISSIPSHSRSGAIFTSTGFAVVLRL